jgi:hypothetical protein
MPRIVRLALPFLAVTLAFPALAHDRDGDRDRRFKARLVGTEEVPPIANTGSGFLRMTLSDDGTAISFQLDYEGLPGPPSAAHLHFGQRGVNGGVAFFFCGGGGKPACPAATSGSVTGTVVAADVLGPAAQGIPAGDLATVLELMRDGITYANMHTEAHPGGEIRGQVSGGRHGFFAPFFGSR